MSVSVKICGLSTAETLDAAVANGAAYIGLLFYPPSPRYVALGQAEALAMRVPDHVGRVGVFVDPDDALVDAAIAAGKLTDLQLHKVTPERAAALRARTGLSIWAAVAVRARTDLDAARGFSGAADRILYDAKTPDNAALPGGMGVRFDWGLLNGFSHPLPWALSGGLDAINVGDAVRQTGATLVDASSGMETAPGIKDIDKIALFLKACAAL
ncbi:MAG: N-(5'-phosphoribosyl)anthranilate isomerase [Sphingomonas sp. 28-62-20]|uniref:phosphoribosylanthranilate isomerase n=1 Tax=Sphingomonas sp. 28-62-20 TaxID=1970433 RepID=UPI000B26A95D|nr:MAG: N-(5'-phosphoribosyl)anthranilate isomerase [Sphingomonas sp. 28-62-20]